MIAASIDAPVAALPWIPELFAPLRALGSQPRRVVAWLRAAGTRPGHRVLDLGCGKGGVAVAIADRLGCQVTGVDAFEPFIGAASDYARQRGTADLCEFRCERIERWRRVNQTYDVVLMLGVWPLNRAAKLVRRLTRPGGLYLIDDAVRVEHLAETPCPAMSSIASGHQPRAVKSDDRQAPRTAPTLRESSWATPPRESLFAKGQERKPAPIAAGVPSADEARRMLESTGDDIQRAHVATRRESQRLEIALFERLRLQAALMARRHPRRRRLLEQCMRRQAEAIELLTGPLRAAVWLVRRSRGSVFDSRGKL